MNHAKIHEEAFSVERVHFKKTDRRVNPRKTDPFIYLEGETRVLVSAPHSVRSVRAGKIKRSDEFTGSLAYLLNSYSGCHTLAVRKLYGGDPNWDAECIYKKRLAEIFDKNRVEVVLDLHGAARERPFDVDLGTMRGKSLLGNKQLQQKLVASLNSEGIADVSLNFFAAEKQATITKFCALELGIPALQLEINHRFRAPNRNGEDYGKLFRALLAFIKNVAS